MGLKRKEEIEVRIEKLVHGGVGFAHLGDFVVMISGGVLPGQKVRARILRKKKKYAKAQLLEVLEHAQNEIEPLCPHFGACGGCKWLTLGYDEQLGIKQQIIKEALFQSNNLHSELMYASIPIHPILPSPKELGYRNKLEFTFGKEHFPSDEFNLGFHRQGRLFDIVDIKHCFFTEEYVSTIVRDIHDLCQHSGLTTHSTASHTGFLRYLIVRSSEHSKKLLLNLVHYTFVDDREKEQFIALKEQLQEYCTNEPHIAGFVLSLSESRADVAKGDTYETLYGEPTINEMIEDLSFTISPYSFFQTNTLGAEVLYNEVKKALQLTGGETLLDLYAGTGTIGIFLSRYAQKVYSIELNPDAVEDAKINARQNGITTIECICGKAEVELPALLARIDAVDCAVIDPPRSGMHPIALETIIKTELKKLVYVSCNPATLNRDLQELIHAGYTVEYVQPVDMFPQTHHVENVVLLRR